MNTRLLAVLGSIALFSAAGLPTIAGTYSAEPDPKAPTPKSDAPKSDQPKTDTPKAVSPKSETPATFPPAEQKKLYAVNDLRGKQAPKFHVEKWLTDKPEMKDKVVLIDFWATWCPPCVALIPELNELQKEFKDDLVIIGISDEPEAKVKPFMKKQGVTYSMAIDTEKKMKDEVDVEGIPHVLVIGADNVVRWQGFPQSKEEKLTKETLKRIIDADKARRAAKKKDAKPAATVPADKK